MHRMTYSGLSAARCSIGILLAGALLTASGCTAESRVAPATQNGSLGPEFGGLRVGLFDELIKQQKTAPDRLVRAIDTLESELVNRLEPLTHAERLAANLSLEQVMASIPEPTLKGPATGHEVITESDRADAIARYLSGRQKCADGKFTDAIDDLVAASRLDPLASEPHRALAEANLALGRTTAAVKSFRDAAARGSKEPRLYWVLGRESLKSGNFAEAASFLKVAQQNVRQALHQAPSGTDRALAALVQCDLAEAAGANGYLRTMVMLRQEVLDQLPEITPPQNLRSEFGDIFRRTGEMHLSNGDALWRLGSFDLAAQEYARAEATGMVDPAATMSRWFGTLVQQGRTAEIADRLLTEAADHPERLDGTRLSLLPSLAQSEAGDALRAGFAELLAQVRPASVSLLLARASAAAAKDTQAARSILAAALTKFEAEPDAVAAYLATWPISAIAARTAALIELVAKNPRDSARFAHALAAEGHDPAAIEAELELHASIPALLLLSQLHSSWGNYAEAFLRIKLVPESSDKLMKAAVFSARGEIAAHNGDWSTADACIEALKVDTSTHSILAQAAIQRVMQRYSPAWINIEAVAGGTPTDAAADRGIMEALLRGAELAARTGKPEVAMSLLGRATAADPHDDRAYGGMAAILSAAKPIDQARVSAVIRELREKCPAGRGVRGFLFQQTIGLDSGNTKSSQRLLAIVKQLPQDAALCEQLAAHAERSAVNSHKLAAQTETLLTELLTQRPGSMPVRRSLARVQAAQGKYDQALVTLEHTPRQIVDLQAMGLREKILKENLKKDVEAKAAATQRAAVLQPGIDPAIEASDQLWRDSKFDEAVARVSIAIAPGAELDIEQQAKLLFMASRAMAPLARLPEEPRQGNSAEGRRALDFFELVALHAGKLLPQHHQARLILLGVNASDDYGRLLAAAKLAGEQHPSLNTASLRLISEAAANEVPRRGGEFLQYAVSNMKEVPPALVTLLVRRAVAFGTLEDVKKAIELAEDPSRVTAVLTELDVVPAKTMTIQQQQAELSYIVASGLTVNGDEVKAEPIYRRALEHDPRHGLANNDLGYALLERGELDKAEHLIEIAAEVLQDRSHVLDSLGWLRYKQGRMKDIAPTAATPASQGAITILERALKLENGNEAAMLDHLGDALWAGGERSKAMAVWQQAGSAAEATLREIRSISVARESLVKELKGIISSAAGKQAAYRSKLEPAIAAWPGRSTPGTPLAAHEEKQNEK